jgi:hypothetical protein
MLTENEARDLLRKAGETIEVDPNTPVHISATPRSRWLILGAAAGVAAISVASWAVSSDDDAGPDRSGPTVSTPTDGVPEGSVPSVFGHDRETGTAFLESLGYQVRIEQKPHCDAPGRAIGTEPATGTPLEKGATVILLVATTGATLDCANLAPLDAWAFVDFANGHAAAPEFAESVTLVVDDGAPVTISRADPADPANWGTPSALTELHEATQYVVQQTEDGTTQYLIPALVTLHGTPPDQNCGVQRPNVVGDRGALTLTVDVATDGAVHCPTTVGLYFTGDRIDTVVTYTEKPATGANTQRQLPDVTGLSLDKARSAVTAAGFTATVEQLPTCDPREGVVVEQAPTQQDLDGFPDDQMWSGAVTLVVEVPHPSRDCAALDAAARGFIRFARGGGPPLWAAEVEQLLGYTSFDRVTADRADDPTAWSLCSGVAPADCTLSPLAVIAASTNVVAAEQRDSYECELIDFGGLPTEVLSEEEIHLFPTGVEGCAQQWDISLWIDDAGRIIAVNLLVPE